jgi:septal ring factor EnvC (AmiA/AmiB activator)
VLGPIKQAVLRVLARCGYIVLKTDHNQRILAELRRLDAELAEAGKRAADLETELAKAGKNFARLATALADARKGHEHALRELEQSRAETCELRDRLAPAVDSGS